MQKEEIWLSLTRNSQKRALHRMLHITSPDQKSVVKPEKNFLGVEVYIIVITLLNASPTHPQSALKHAFMRDFSFYQYFPKFRIKTQIFLFIF
jgi:hypothetical protein